MPRSIALILCLCVSVLAIAAESDKGAKKDKPEKPTPEERQSVTQHRIRIDGEVINYTATAGTIHLTNDDDEPRASIFYIAYTRDGVANADERPVTFTFNGGPGSSSVWLHMGAFGPRKVDFPDAVQPKPAPYAVGDNPGSLLDVTDLVFIDPVGTGFSRTLGEAEAKDFLGVQEDLNSVGDFVRLWVTRNGRWNSPKFIAGESYGTTRAAGLVDHLQQQEGMFFDGVMLVSVVLNFQTLRFETGNDLPHIMILPSMAATAWYHGALDPKPEDLEGFLDEVRAFATGDYASALMLGAQLGDAEGRRIAGRVAGYTGLSTDYVLQSNLRLSTGRFTKELLRDQRQTVGRLDSRYIGLDRDAAGEGYEHDPSYTAIQGPYTAIVNDYLRTDLGFETDRKYEILSFNVNRSWNWDVDGRTGYINVAENLRSAMSRNTDLKVFAANGYYDLATPFFGTEYTMDHLQLEPQLRDNITLAYYPAGHMMYIHPPSLLKLKNDIAAFIAAATE
jgi:carboxypeptidase C (cathepsin A)